LEFGEFVPSEHPIVFGDMNIIVSSNENMGGSYIRDFSRETMDKLVED
jgi:hypothetical protein